MCAFTVWTCVACVCLFWGLSEYCSVQSLFLVFASLKCVTVSLLHCTHCTHFRNIISVKCELLQSFCSFLIWILFYFENIGIHSLHTRAQTFLCSLVFGVHPCVYNACASECVCACACVSCLPYKYVCWISVQICNIDFYFITKAHFLSLFPISVNMLAIHCYKQIQSQTSGLRIYRCLNCVPSINLDISQNGKKYNGKVQRTMNVIKIIKYRRKISACVHKVASSILYSLFVHFIYTA